MAGKSEGEVWLSQRSVYRDVSSKRESPASAMNGHGDQLVWGYRFRGDELICIDSVNCCNT